MERRLSIQYSLRGTQKRSLATLLRSGLVLSGFIIPIALTVHAIDFAPGDLIYEETFEGETGLPTTPETDLSEIGSLSQAATVGMIGLAEGRSRFTGDHAGSLFELDSVFLQGALGSGGTGNVGIRAKIRSQLGLAGDFPLTHLSLSMKFGAQQVEFQVPVRPTGRMAAGFQGVEFLETLNPIGLSFVEKDVSDAIQSGSAYTVDLFFDRASGRAVGTISVNDRVHTSQVVDFPDVGSTPLGEFSVGIIVTGVGGPVSSSVDVESIEIYAADSTASPSPLIVSTRKVGALDGITGPLDSGDRFGISMNNIGDQNGDGVDDLAVGADHDGDGGFRTGAIYILFMNSDGTVASEQKISALSGNFPGTLNTSDRFGQPIEVLADLDGDGRREIAVGARRTAGGGVARGAVWILDLNADGTVESASKIAENEGGFVGTLPDGSNFSTVTNLGDVDGDGFDDLAVGAWGDSGVGAEVGGAVWILFLDAAGIVQAQQKISASQGGLGAILDAGDRFGAGVAGIGDIDGDGIPDLAVGVDSADSPLPSVIDLGEVWILRLKSDGTVRDTKRIRGFPAFGETGLPIGPGDVFGLGLTALGDFNGDGIPDLAAGSAGYESPLGLGDTGSVYFLYLNADGSLKDYRLISDRVGGFDPLLDDSDFMGVGLQALGDLDGDGRLDLGIGATGDDDGTLNAGAFYLVNIEPDASCDWIRYLDPAEVTAAFPTGAEIFDLSTVAFGSNGDAGFSNGHDFGRFTWTSLSITNDIDLFGTPDPDGTLWVTDQFAPPIQAFPGAGGPAGSIEDNDDFRLDFGEPMVAAGLEILENRSDLGERIEFLDAVGNTIADFEIPGSALGAPGGDGGGFLGISVCPGHPGITSIVVHEGNATNSDNDDIGFTNVTSVPIPEPSFNLALGAGLLGLLVAGSRRRLAA